jgi:CheY-like chemotaxis protein
MVAFDVMVSDIQMHGIDGLELLRAVRDYDLDLCARPVAVAPVCLHFAPLNLVR